MVYVCNLCKKTFIREERLENHIKRSCNPTTCKICHKTFRDYRRLQQHESLHTPFTSKKECATCGKKFKLAKHLKNHQKNAEPKTCDECDKTFCHQSQLERHKRTVHFGTSHQVDPSELDRPILPATGYEKTEGYLEQVDKHMKEIRDSRTGKEFYTFLNKQLTPGFTYKDLKDILDNIAYERGTAVKINIGFGFMLYHTIQEKFRYFFSSSNNLLFDRAVTILETKDMSSLMERIIELDLTESYYLKRPSSGWVLAGLPNLSIQIFNLIGVPLG